MIRIDLLNNKFDALLSERVADILLIGLARLATPWSRYARWRDSGMRTPDGGRIYGGDRVWHLCDLRRSVVLSQRTGLAYDKVPYSQALLRQNAELNAGLEAWRTLVKETIATLRNLTPGQTRDTTGGSNADRL